MAKAPESLRLVALQAENFKRLVAVNIRPDGSVIQITGKNGAGKSSCLDAIWAALAGKSAIQKMPIRKGAKEAVINLDLGHLKVRRTFKADDEGGYTTGITVESIENGKFKSPQAVLDGLLGDISFDPLLFVRKPAKEQFDMLRGFVPDVDFVKIEGLNRKDYDDRREKNAQARQLRAQADAIAIPEVVPSEAIDVDALVKELAAASEHNTAIAQQAMNRQAVEADIASGERAAAKYREEAAQLIARAEQIEKDVAATKERLASQPPLPEPIDVADLQKRIQAAKATNEAKAAFDRKADLIADAEIAEAAAAELTKRIEDRNTAKMAAIAKAKMPVAGLGFGDEVVLLNGVPFDQASAAEQLRAATAIAMRMNPKLRIILIKDGSLLDSDSMKVLADLAEENDFQVFVERVDTSGKVGFVIEDGRVVSAPAQEAAE